MFQILGILDKTGSGILYSIVSGVYSTVARIYDIMIDLVRQSDEMFQIGLSNILDIAYVIAGVFMLFRVMIAMVQYFLDPDQISNNSAGAGKLLTRIVVSIVLLIALQPSGFILGEDGLLKNVERAVLAPDGVITRIIDSKPVNDFPTGKDAYDYGRNNNNSSGSSSGSSSSSSSSINSNPDVTSCYYWKLNANDIETTTQYNAADFTYYRIDFSKKEKNSGKTFEKITGSDKWYFYSYGSNVRVGGENGPKNKDTGKSFYYTKLNNMKISTVNENNLYYTKSSDFSVCPKSIVPKIRSWSDPGTTPKFPAYGNPPVTATISKYDYPDKFVPYGLYGGATSVKGLHNHLKEFAANKQDNLSFIWDFNMEGVEENDQKYLTNLKNREESLDFSQTVAGTFIECSSDLNCDAIKANMLASSNGSAAVVDNMGEDKITLDFFTAVFAGIVLIVYLLILCIDIIVRRLKLIFMEMLSPIPIVSYVDPKDKMFNQWFKMYMSTYADLFIKLIAMAMLVTLVDKDNLTALWGTGAGPIVKFFYIVAILVFVRLVPSLLSKILGLDINGGSFKDIGKMAKAGLGLGAGAVIGGAVGAATGKGLGVVSGFARGALMGAGSGAKGKVLGGAQGVAAKNATINQQKADGFNFMDRAAISMANAVGYSPKTRLDNQIKQDVDSMEMLDNHRKHKDNIEAAAEKSAFLSDLKTRMANGEIGKEEYKAIRKAFIKHVDSGSKEAFKTSSVTVEDENGIKRAVKDKSGNYIKETWSYNDGDVDKITHAIDIAKDSYISNNALQKEITVANGGKPISINTYQDYLDTEGIATNARNQKERDITKVKSSDEYARAEAFEKAKKS